MYIEPMREKKMVGYEIYRRRTVLSVLCAYL
jgi:hypothetical protein